MSAYADSFQSSSEDNSDGVEASLDFDQIDRTRESVSFDEFAESLAINDYQGKNLYIFYFNFFLNFIYFIFFYYFILLHINLYFHFIFYIFI